MDLSPPKALAPNELNEATLIDAVDLMPMT